LGHKEQEKQENEISTLKHLLVLLFFVAKPHLLPLLPFVVKPYLLILLFFVAN